MKASIWQPLGMRDITFWPEQHLSMKDRMASMTIRDERTGNVIHEPHGPKFPGGKDCFGGHGASASMPEYFKVLRSLLNDDERLLKRSTTAQMFLPQLTKESQEAQKFFLADPANTKHFVGEFPKHVPLDHSFGGILTMEADKGWRGQHTMIWSGYPNLFWVILRSFNSLYGKRGQADLDTVHRSRSRSLWLIRRPSTAARRFEGW